MAKMHHYYEELANTKYTDHLEMCKDLGVNLQDLYTDEIDEEDLY